MTAEVMQQDVIIKLNKEFIKEDAAIIQDVAATCGYDYDKSYKALSDLFGTCNSASSIVPSELRDAVPPAKSLAEDQQTVPDMSVNKSKDQSVPNGMSYASSAINTGPKPNSGAIRKTTFTLKNNRKSVKSSVNKINVDRIKRMLMEKWNVLVILRGLPGSGKSFLSKELTDMADECGFVYQVCSADHHFIRPNGQYNFNPAELQNAHDASKKKATIAMSQKNQLVIIDNTNVKEWEMQHYVVSGVQNKYHVEVMEPLTGWKFNIGQLRDKNIHSVPDTSIKKMKENYQEFTADYILNFFNLDKSNQRILSELPVLLEAKPASVQSVEPEMINNDLKTNQALPQRFEATSSIQGPVQTEQHLLTSQTVLEDDEEEIIDYEGVPESDREFYKKLPELYPNYDRQLVRHLYKENHCDQEYFFNAVENSAHLLKTCQMNSKPLMTPIRKDVKVATATTFEPVAKKAPVELSQEALELKKVIEGKVVIPKKEKEEKKTVIEEKEAADDDIDSTNSGEEDEFDAKIDKEFARNLLFTFGGPFQVEDLEDDALKIKIPSSLACKIHSLWMEALQRHINLREANVQQQLDLDYEIAKSLSRGEQIEVKPKPNMEDIIEMEKALAAVKKMQIGESKNDIATKMSRQKLMEEFPSMDPIAIENIFESSNRDYNEAAKAIREMYQTDSSAKNVYSPEGLERLEEELVEKAKKESLRLPVKKEPLFVDVIPIRQRPTSEIDEAQMVEDITKFRLEAKAAHFGKVTALKSAEESLQKKMNAAAGYYSDIAKSWAAKLEAANSQVPNIVLQNASPEFLDLHYVFVSEALTILDIFLDFHVKRRHEDPTIGSEVVEIVTGRGRRSQDGKAKIKPAIIKKLKQRGIKFEESNPGALRVYLSKSLQFSSNYSVDSEDE